MHARISQDGHIDRRTYVLFSVPFQMYAYCTMGTSTDVHTYFCTLPNVCISHDGHIDRRTYVFSYLPNVCISHDGHIDRRTYVSLVPYQMYAYRTMDTSTDVHTYLSTLANACLSHDGHIDRRKYVFYGPLNICISHGGYIERRTYITANYL
jgi:hypothetical protein